MVLGEEALTECSIELQNLKYSTRWHKIKIGDLIVVIEGYNRIFGVVEITSDPFDDENEEGDKQADR